MKGIDESWHELARKISDSCGATFVKVVNDYPLPSIRLGYNGYPVSEKEINKLVEIADNGMLREWKISLPKANETAHFIFYFMYGSER